MLNLNSVVEFLFVMDSYGDILNCLYLSSFFEEVILFDALYMKFKTLVLHSKHFVNLRLDAGFLCPNVTHYASLLNQIRS